MATGVQRYKDIICRSKDEKMPVFVTKVRQRPLLVNGDFTYSRIIVIELCASQVSMCDGVTLCNSQLPLLPNFVLRLLPSLIIYNLLPCALIVDIPSVEFNVRIEAGGKSSVYSLDLNAKNTISVEVSPSVIHRENQRRAINRADDRLNDFRFRCISGSRGLAA